MRYDTQQLLFQESPYVASFKKKEVNIPESFYEKGYAVIDGIAGPDEALEKLQYDLYYAKNASFGFDVLTLLKTIKVVFGGKGR